MKKIVSIYFVGLILFVIGFSLFVRSHSMITSSFNDTTEPFKMGSISNYLEDVPELKNHHIETTNLVFEYNYSDKMKANHILYPTFHLPESQIGTLKIKSLSLEAPIYFDMDYQHLYNGVAHYNKSVLPGEAEHSVLLGRDSTTLNGIENVAEDELIVISTSAGLFTYQVQDIYVVSDKDNSFMDQTGEPSLSLVSGFSSDDTAQVLVVYSVLVDYQILT